MQDYEKLGAFYLGRPWDLASGEPGEGATLYDSRDLTTHAICVGMTGSGKTGLCVGLLEEAAIDGIPAIVIDPKGDLGNLLLTFPQFRPKDFRPWIQEDEAHAKGLSPDEFAAQQAQLWKNGLASWGQGPDRVRRLKEAADFAIYTPGSSAGLPLAILKGFAAPPPALRDDADMYRERIQGTATSLLALLGMEADPIQDREHILLSTILQHHWDRGEDLDLGRLIRELQDPPVARIGVMDLESFYPARDRFALSMKLNNLLAAPGFASWMEGEPLDVGRLLRAPDGRPRISVLSIAHLGDAERMFFVSLLYNEVLSWMRQQEGTSSLRAIVYMDEVAGYCPPSANPPSKAPILTLMKQARAFGVGMVLSTQNPVDLDYKGLSNAGTWMIGRLQTERDRERLLDGLESASAGGLDRKQAGALLAGLKKRVFLLHNVHEKAPVTFETRWVMSYLRGPLTRDQVRTLMDPRREAATPPPPTAAQAALAGASPLAAAPVTAVGQPADRGRPPLPPGVPECFAAVVRPGPTGATLRYRAALVGEASLLWSHARSGIDEERNIAMVAPFPEEAREDPWPEARGPEPVELVQEPDGNGRFGPLPALASDPKLYPRLERALKDWLYREMPLTIWYCKDYRMWSAAGEDEGAFRGRVAEAARADRDADIEELRKRYATRLERLEEKVRKAEQVVAREQEQQQGQRLQTAINVGTTLLGAFLGGRRSTRGTVGKAATAARSASRAGKEAGDVQRAQANLEAARAKLIEMDEEFREEVAGLEDSFDPTAIELREVEVKPRKADIAVRRCALLWLPTWVDADGAREPAWR